MEFSCSSSGRAFQEWTALQLAERLRCSIDDPQEGAPFKPTIPAITLDRLRALHEAALREAPELILVTEHWASLMPTDHRAFAKAFSTRLGLSFRSIDEYQRR